MYIYIYVYVYVYMHMCIYMYMYTFISKHKLVCVCISCQSKLKKIINVGRKKKITGKKGKISIKAFDTINRGFRRNFLTVSIWYLMKTV